MDWELPVTDFTACPTIRKFPNLSQEVILPASTKILPKNYGIGSWEEGLYHVKKDGSIENLHHEPGNPNSLCSNFVRSCSEDNAGNLLDRNLSRVKSL